MHKQISQWLVLLFACCALLFVAGTALRARPQDNLAPSELPLQRLESRITGNFPLQANLRRTALQLRLLGGQLEQGDIFITDGGLIRNIDAADPLYLRQNTQTVLQFAEESGAPTYLLLIPTSSAILQEHLPPYAEVYNNQRRLIEDVYQQMLGTVTTVDVYPTLFNHRSEYIYYRTEDNLTALGGYYIYSVLGAKLVGREVYSIDQFDIAYLETPVYGSLYQTLPYPDLRPDIVTFYHLARIPRSYHVKHTGEGISRRYNTLYPTHLVELGNPMDTSLGGVSPMIRIRSSAPNARSLLVFGDHTALSYLPFLANNYHEILLVDLSTLPPALLDEIQLEEFQQILFAYSVETFNTDVPHRAISLLQPVA